jgi:hypothetical protein
MIPEAADPDDPIGYDADDEPIYAVKSEERSSVAVMPGQQGRTVPKNWKPTYEKPIPVVQCTKVKADGNRCGRWSIRGLDRCVKHAGWNLPAVRAKAEARVDAARLILVDAGPEAAEWLVELGQNASSEAVRLKAATEVLDRIGVKGGTDVTVTVETNNPADELRQRLAALKSRQVPHEDDTVGTIDGEIVDDPEETPHGDT